MDHTPPEIKITIIEQLISLGSFNLQNLNLISKQWKNLFDTETNQNKIIKNLQICFSFKVSLPSKINFTKKCIMHCICEKEVAQIPKYSENQLPHVCKRMYAIENGDFAVIAVEKNDKSKGHFLVYTKIYNDRQISISEKREEYEDYAEVRRVIAQAKERGASQGKMVFGAILR